MLSPADVARRAVDDLRNSRPHARGERPPRFVDANVPSRLVAEVASRLLADGFDQLVDSGDVDRDALRVVPRERIVKALGEFRFCRGWAVEIAEWIGRF